MSTYFIESSAVMPSLQFSVFRAIHDVLKFHRVYGVMLCQPTHHSGVGENRALILSND